MTTYHIVLDIHKHTPTALTDEQVVFLTKNLTVQETLGNKTSGVWLEALNSAVLIEADSPGEAERIYNANLNW